MATECQPQVRQKNLWLRERIGNGAQSAPYGTVIIIVTNPVWLRSLLVLNYRRDHLSGNLGFLYQVITDRLKGDSPSRKHEDSHETNQQ
jgi:hypothetical protein